MEPMSKEELSEYLDRPVVVDTAAPFIYIGTLNHVGKRFITLKDVDVHHLEPGGAGKEMYALTARKYGASRNRAYTKIRVDMIVSISLLEDVIVY
jgi:small nuclear ribonucleoprotein (snRNP)-like protein